MVVGEPSSLLEDPVGFFDYSVVLEAAAEDEVGDYMVEGSVGKFEGLDVHDFEFDIVGMAVLSPLPCNVKPARQYVDADYGDACHLILLTIVKGMTLGEE